jgi:hypothetical protein
MHNSLLKVEEKIIHFTTEEQDMINSLIRIALFVAKNFSFLHNNKCVTRPEA